MGLPYRQSWDSNGGETHLSLFMTQLLKFLQAGGGAAIGYNTVEKAVEINFVLGEKFQNVTVTLVAIVSDFSNLSRAIFICLCKLNGEIPETKKEEYRYTYKNSASDSIPMSVEEYREYCRAKGEFANNSTYRMSEEEIEARTKYQ